MINFELLHPRMTQAHLGFIPEWLDPNIQASAKQQLDWHYKHGGGWNPFEGFILQDDNSLTYPGDPPLKPLAQAQFRDEIILFYDCAWVAIVQPDRSFEVCRMD